MSTKKMGKIWEFKNSIWLWAIILLPGFSWSAFWYVGAKTKKVKWKLAALAYGCPIILLLIVAFISGSHHKDKDWEWASTIGSWLIVICMISWPISIGHGWRIRKEFLLRMEALESINHGADNYETEVLRQQIKQEYRPMAPSGVKSGMVQGGANLPSELSTAHSIVSTPASHPERQAVLSAEATVTVDLNRATVDELAALPGMNRTLARRAVEHRNTSGGFASLEDFSDELGLQPHVAERIRPHVIVTATTNTTTLASLSSSGGRVIDY